MSPIELRPVILAGGAGTRLWPLSREGYPKQLLRLHGQHTLLQDTVLRVDGLGADPQAETNRVALADPIIVCHEQHRFFVAEQMRGIERRVGRIVLEPASRNTAPALTIAALAAAADGADPALLVMPADHVIESREAFHAAVQQGLELARGRTVVTFGIVPTRPETGYGYIRKGLTLDGQYGACRIGEFVEKPDADTATRYLASGDYLWNAGLFLVRAAVWLDAIERFQPEMASMCKEAFARGSADGDFYRIDPDLFGACPSNSIDYGVMECLGAKDAEGRRNDPTVIGAAVVPLDAGWSDVGSWPALMELNGRDASGNVTVGDVYARATENSLVLSNSRFVATVGLRDTIVVETADAVLVAHKHECQDVKHVVEWLREEGREEGINHRRVYRPWGDYEQLDNAARFQVKRLTVKPGHALSLQMHHHRAEHWVVVRGTAKVTRGDEQFLLTENESTYIPIGMRHRLENPGTLPLEVIEVQTGSYLGEDDIVRFEDVYRRDRFE